jgi:hypothetical protein
VSRGKPSPGPCAPSALAGVALGILFTTLLAASNNGPALDLLRRPDAVVAVVCLLVNMCALLGTAVAATSLTFRNPHDRRPGGGRRALIPIRVATKRPL